MKLTVYWNLTTYTLAMFVAAVAAWQHTGSMWAGVMVAAFLEALHYLLAFQLERTAQHSQELAEAAAEKAQEFIVAHGGEAMRPPPAEKPRQGFPEGVAKAVRKPPNAA